MLKHLALCVYSNRDKDAQKEVTLTLVQVCEIVSAIRTRIGEIIIESDTHYINLLQCITKPVIIIVQGIHAVSCSCVLHVYINCLVSVLLQIYPCI